MCGCECCIYAKSIHSSFLSWRDRYLKKIKNKIQNHQIRRSGKNHITYMKHIKIQLCHMGVIFMPKHLICKRLQCAHILILIMHFHTGNVFCDVLTTVHVSMFMTKKQINNMKKQHPLVGFTFIT